MDRVCEELDDAKAEIEKLKADYRIKAEFSERLKRAHNEQLAKIRDLGLKLEKQGDELIERAEEISSVKQMYEDIKCRLDEKEGIVQNLKSAYEKLRVDSGEKSKKLEEENRELAKTLDDANERKIDQEQKIHAFMEEIEGLKGILSVTQRKCSEAEEKSRATKEPRKRDDMFLTLEEESERVKDQLKWKKEQFKHLEDAHEKLREQYCVGKKEWELEKLKLLDELCSLQTSLESQTRISEDLQNRLKMCHQALAHEESRRRYLEVQLSESKTCFESVFSECEKAKHKLENLTLQRDKEIAALRNSLGSKGTVYKEMEYTVAKLERENQDLLASLKELQEVQIREAGSFSSTGKLKNKLKNMEQLHRGCSVNLKAKEEEWCSQMEKLSGNLNDSISELKSKDMAIEELKMELDGNHSLITQLKLQNEEGSLILLVLKSEFAEAMSKLNAEKSNMDSLDKERQEHIAHLLQQLELKDGALVKAQMIIEEESEKSASLLRRIEALDVSEHQLVLLQMELQRHKEMLEESSTYQLHLKDQALQMESHFEEKLREVCDAYDTVDTELAERICEGNETEFELQVWKSVAERLKTDLEENHGKCREIEDSLLAQVEVEETLKREKDGLIQVAEEKDRRIGALQQQIVLLNQELEKTRTEIKRIESEQETIEEKDRISDIQQLETERLEELQRAKLECAFHAQIDAERTFKAEKEDLLSIVEEKDQKVHHLEQLVKSMEQNSSSFCSQLEQKQTQLDSAREAWQKIAAADALKVTEIVEKNMMIAELKNDICSLKQKVELQEDIMSCSRQRLEKIKADLGEKQLEVKELRYQLETKLRDSDTNVDKLEDEKSMLLDDITKLSCERENLLDFLWDLGDKIGKYSSEDMQLMGMLNKIVETCNTESVDMDLEGNDDLSHPTTKESMGVHLSPTMKKSVTVPFQRSPFRELNG